ncbi:UNVERIFIED_CONTAM: Retrovirus-related Pol polyprotein from transposon RE2 [Sesamum radiatum]|uniref:Retrovirus-related Pol polyprotein from transposon RE2 n=1 Tax=Sesamum radiatum TaxID=300843 RepID=A0AAW2REN2_SESRA
MPQLNGVAERRNRTLLDMVRSMMSFTELSPSFLGYALETAAKLLNITPSKIIEYPKETAGYYFYDPAEQKIFVSRNAVFLEKGFYWIADVMRSTRESRVLKRYGFIGLTSQLDNDPKTYGEAMSDINSDKWLEAMKFEIDSMGSNQVWTLVDPPKGARPVRLVAKGYTQRPGVDFEETYSPVAMAKSIRILLAIAARYDYEIWKMDVKTAFLNGFVEEEIFMDQPEGLTVAREE